MAREQAVKLAHNAAVKRAGSATLSKAEAAYVGPFDRRPDAEQCSECTMFIEPIGGPGGFGNPGACTLVKGDIHPAGWCKHFKERHGKKAL